MGWRAKPNRHKHEHSSSSLVLSTPATPRGPATSIPPWVDASPSCLQHLLAYHSFLLFNFASSWAAPCCLEASAVNPVLGSYWGSLPGEGCAGGPSLIASGAFLIHPPVDARTPFVICQASGGTGLLNEHICTLAGHQLQPLAPPCLSFPVAISLPPPPLTCHSSSLSRLIFISHCPDALLLRHAWSFSTIPAAGRVTSSHAGCFTWIPAEALHSLEQDFFCSQ